MSSLFDETHQVATYLKGNRLRSAFQPIFSFSHNRLIGHEALIRATDPAGRPLSPPALFAKCADAAASQRLDRACATLHLTSYAQQREDAQWLFLNIDVSAFVVDGLRRSSPQRSSFTQTLLDATTAVGLEPNQIVIELLEAALPDIDQVEQLTDELKRVGFNLALDDFGAGHSNFDRVFRLKPDIVKLDRSVIARAAIDPRVRRVMGQMISLLHECGTQVLIEGVENADEAAIALDSDADLVQGYHFARPHGTLRRRNELSRELADLWIGNDERNRRDSEAIDARVAPYREALVEATRLLVAGRAVPIACDAFVKLPNADRCYLLDDRGQITGPRAFHVEATSGETLAGRFAPLVDIRGSRWSRRAYFRNALAAPGQLFVTRPYPAMHGPLMTVTFSLSFAMDGRTFVLCGDKNWREDTKRPIRRADRRETASAR